MKRFLLISVLIGPFSLLTAQYSVKGGSGIPFRAKDDTQNRLEVYLLNGLSEARIDFTSSNPGTHQWYRYKESGNNAIPIASVQDGNTSYVTDVSDGYGYFVGSPTEERPHYVWIIDYSRYLPRFFDLKAVEEDDKCKSLKILADIEAEPLIYYLPSGSFLNLDRTYQLQYDTQVWTEDSRQFSPSEEKGVMYGSEKEIKAPLVDTYFTLTGDHFAEYFGIPQAIRSDEYRAIAVEVYGTAETTKEHFVNEIHHAGDALGGSSPIEYTFTAYANEPVAVFYVWRILQRNSKNGEMTTIVRQPDKVLRYNFVQEGFYRVELKVNDGSPCFDSIPPFIVTIDSTVIKIPNAFSPGSSIGVNDELRIAFSSVIAFKASVYNRWGNLLFQWSDPSRGWDGRVNGKFVPTGVYYVIVEYKDSSGKNKTMSRAVNVLRTKK